MPPSYDRGSHAFIPDLPAVPNFVCFHHTRLYPSAIYWRSFPTKYYLRVSARLVNSASFSPCYFNMHTHQLARLSILLQAMLAHRARKLSKLGA